MPRFRNEEAEKAQYTDGDVVWVKIHNTEIWWPGEVTSSQDFRFVNTSRPPFAVVAFFNEKTFEQVKSAKLICPFQCTQKEEFIKRGTKKADGLHIGDKFSDDVAIAESRYQRQDLGGSHSHPESGSGPAVRPDSLIKALLSSSSSNQNSSTRSSSGAPSPSSRQEPTFRIMDIGGTPDHARERRCDEASYECNICSFRTNSMSVLLIHRRAHMDTSSNYSSHSTSTSTNTSVSSFNPSRQTRATRRANTTNALDHRQLTVRSSRDSTLFHKNSVRCHSRHVSIVVDAPLTDEAQQKVASIVKMTMASIERVVHPSDTSSTASNSTRSRSRSNRNSLSPKVPAAVAPRRSSLNPRDPRSQRANQLRATMPAPQSPAKQRRLTRSMSRRQQAMSPPAQASELPPPLPVSTQRRSAGRRRTLATGVNEQSAPPARRGNPMRKTVTAAPAPVHAPTEHPPESAIKRQKRAHSRHRATVSLASPSVSSAPPVPPPVVGEESSTLPVAVLDPISSLELQLSLLAEWCDDEIEDPPEELSAQQLATVTNGKKMEKVSWEPDRKTEEEQKGEEQEQAVKKRIRNIPKKDRRDMEVQEFDTDGQLETSDEPIVIQDSDASSNESVVFVENEPRQRKKSVNLHPGANASEKVKSLTLSKQVSANMSSCFDFEEEEELQDGQNGLSYRHCTTRLDGKGHFEPEAPEAPNEESGAAKAAYDELFRGFDEGHPLAANASFGSEIEEKESSASEERILEAQETETADEVASDADANAKVKAEGEAKTEDEANLEADVDAEACDHLNLPIRELQKRFFKSRNKSALAAVPKEEDLPANPDREEEDLANGRTPPALNGEEDHSSRRESNNSHSNVNSNTNITADINSSAGGRGSGSKRHSQSKSGSKHRKKSKTETTRRQPRRSKTNTRLQNIALEELSNNSNTTSSNSNASCHSNPLSTASARSSARLRSHARGAISPGLSSSTSCSIASNIAVISAEEARELQRSASGAGLVHSSIVDATQPVQRGGVLILEDIRLPNLYEPFAGLQSSDSNDSRQQILRSRHEHEDRTQDSAEVYLHADVNADMEMEAKMEAEAEAEVVAYVGAESDTEVDAEAHMYANEEHDPEEEAREHHDQGVMSEADDQIADYAADEDLESESGSQTAPDLDSWPHEEVQFVPKPREVLLKKREQELLRQYEADLASGRSVEKCRRARERWSRAVNPIEDVKPSPLESLEPEETDLEHVVNDISTVFQNSAELEEAVSIANHNIGPMDWEDSMAQQLAAVEAALPAILMSPARRPASHPGINSHSLDPSFSLSTISPSKSSGDLAHVPCDAVFKAHQQLEQLCEQRRRRSSQTFASALSTPSVPASPLPPAMAGGTRRPRRRSRTVTSNELAETPARSDATEESLCEQKDGSESLENPPQLCAGRICAVMTRPIPGYNHTFMLCSLANNNFTPLNNVALYLDSEKNHLVPVPREALLEPPRLADGHPLSAVFADIDFLGGEAVAQVVDPNDPQGDAGLAQSEVRFSPPQIVLSNADELQGEPTETLGIMTPLSQVAEGCTGAVTSFSNEEEELFVDQLPDNMLQLNVNGHRLELDPSVLASIAQQPDTCIELSVVETGPDGSGTMAVLHAQDILEAAEAYLQERDLQLVNLEEPALGQGTVVSESVTASALVVHAPNLLPALLASGGAVVDDSVDDFVDATDAGVGLLHIDTRTSGGPGLLDVGDVVEESNGMVFISHALPPQAAHSHLTPPITARTNETNALLDQTPIMSTLENPSGVQLRRVSPLVDGNLEDSLAVIGVTHGSGVPTSLELPITVTNPAIAPRMAADIVHFGPFQ